MTLSQKISSVLIISVLIAGIIIGIFSLSTTKNSFNQYVFQTRENQLGHWEEIYKQYYLVNGSWQGIDKRPLMRGHMGGRAGKGINRQGIILADSQGHIINYPPLENVGKTIEEDMLNKGRALKLDNDIIGYIFPLEFFVPEARELEKNFTRSVLKSIILGTIAASLLAIILGIWLAHKLTLPLMSLEKASQDIAKGEFTKKIPLTSQDEIGNVAQAFNAMAEELDKSNSLRKQMFADISHELRTPLTILGSGLENALENNQTLSMEKTSVLYDEVIRLQGLIAELQNLSLLEAGQIKLNIVPIDLHEFTKNLENLLQAEAKSRNVNLIIKISEKVKYLKADPQRLKQIILNLLNNAFRYTPSAGTVSLLIFSQKEKIIMEISDTGPGIPAEDLPFIFQRFYRGDKSRDRSTGGLGLGLAIAKGYVEAHGGKIKAESTVNKGTKFIIEFFN